MPLYEYVCASCGTAFERYVRAWNEEVRCPSCQAGEVEKQVSAFAMSGAGGGGGCGCGRGGCGCGH